MKNKKLLKTLLIIIVLIVLALFIKYIIFFNKVKDNFLTAMYDLSRTGNYHIICRKSGGGAGDNFLMERISKPGETYTEYDKDESEFSYIYITKDKENIAINKNLNTYEFTNEDVIMPDFLELEDYSKYKIVGVKKGEYEGKDCYIIKAKKSVKNEDKITSTIYVNTETYLPYIIKNEIEKYNYDTQKYEDLIKTQDEYELIEEGTVKSIPEVDLSKYKLLDFYDDE